MKLKEVFFRNIEENIAPVIYFHQIDPKIAAQEVAEYVFTTRPSSKGVQVGGIHEQMTSLLNEIRKAVKHGDKLPSSWISGYFGSGKSSFAKLLGLALDGMKLPDGKTMKQALIERDDTPNFTELKEAFVKLEEEIKSIAVLFDIGSVAKNDENIAHTAYRQVLIKLGYSPHDGVAYYEMALEDEGRFEEFTQVYEEEYGRSWSSRSGSPLAPQEFRKIYKKLYPDQDDLLEVSNFNINSLNVQKLVANMRKALKRRAPGKTMFMIIDEVSQYIINDYNKMLSLQSFVSEIGGGARPGTSPLWLLVTGQEKLEEQSKDSVFFKLKDRFPPPLRVHLDRANVREVVSRRLLKKKANSALHEMVSDEHLDSLKLYGYKCQNITRENLIEHYPLLPEHIPLFMDITQNIRNRSTRTQSDAGGVRSVLNNVWDIFNREPVALKNRELGTLLTLDFLYDIIGSSIDSDVQLTLHKVFEETGAESWEAKVVKAIALLEMNAEQEPVTDELLASLLYPKLGSAPVLDEVKNALEELRRKNWVHYHDKNGYLIQSNAAQDWVREKQGITVSPQKITEHVIELQKTILASVNQPVLENTRFPIEAWWGYDQKIYGKNEITKVFVRFHWVTNKQLRENTSQWVNDSKQEAKVFHWVSGDTAAIESKVRDYEKSMRMVGKYKDRANISISKKELMLREQADAERAWDYVLKDLRESWMQGTFYFNGDLSEMSQSGTTFENALKDEIESKLDKLYHKFSMGNIDIHQKDFEQLLMKDTSGLSTVFFKGPKKLGIAYSDAGKILFRCEGQVPQEVYRHIDYKGYQTGEQLQLHFGAPPFGYSLIVIKATVIGLLREEKIRLIDSDSTQDEITSIQDPGAKTVFEQDRKFKKLEIEVNKQPGLTGRDRNAIRRFFENKLGLQHVENDSEELADLVFRHFPVIKDRIGTIQNKIISIGLSAPQELSDFTHILTECLESRQMQKTLERVKRNLQTIEQRYAHLEELEDTLTPDCETELRRLRSILDYQVEQLRQVERSNEVEADIEALENQLNGSDPWRGYADAKPNADRIEEYYRNVRVELKQRIQHVLDDQLEQIQLRSDFADLDSEQQQEVLQRIRRSGIDIDENAVQPNLLLIRQNPDRIREAASEAHNMVDTMISGAEGEEEKRVHTVSIGLRNKIIESEEELNSVLGDLKDRCLFELNQGAKVRLEE